MNKHQAELLQALNDLMERLGQTDNKHSRNVVMDSIELGDDMIALRIHWENRSHNPIIGTTERHSFHSVPRER